jgi:uncharacterized membrane protein YphA (DoxX/SURF4 family)
MTERHKDNWQGRVQPRADFFFRLILGAVFVWAGGTKIANPHDFAIVISNYQILPDYLVNSVAVWLPWVEVLCGALLICGIWVDGSLIVINTLLIVFMAALVSNGVRGIDVDCGCFSTAARGGQSNYLLDIARDGALLGMGLWVLYTRVRFHRN